MRTHRNTQISMSREARSCFAGKNHKVGLDTVFTNRKSASYSHDLPKKTYGTPPLRHEVDNLMILVSGIALSFFLSQCILIISK